MSIKNKQTTANAIVYMCKKLGQSPDDVVKHLRDGLNAASQKGVCRCCGRQITYDLVYGQVSALWDENIRDQADEGKIRYMHQCMNYEAIHFRNSDGTHEMKWVRIDKEGYCDKEAKKKVALSSVCVDCEIAKRKITSVSQRLSQFTEALALVNKMSA